MCVCVFAELTLLLFGVQLCDADGETVHALLQRVDPEGEGVGLVEELSKQVLCIFTYTHTHTQVSTCYNSNLNSFICLKVKDVRCRIAVHDLKDNPVGYV